MLSLGFALHFESWESSVKSIVGMRLGVVGKSNFVSGQIVFLGCWVLQAKLVLSGEFALTRSVIATFVSSGAGI